MTTKVTIEVPETATYCARVLIRSGTANIHEEIVLPGTKLERYVYQGCSIASIEEIELPDNH